MVQRCFVLLLIGVSGWAVVHDAEADEGPALSRKERVSYDRQIRPLLQARCHGCHQPAKASGEYVMTSFDRLIRGGESEEAAIVPRHPEKSPLVELITPENGEAEMPQDKKPLSKEEIALIQRWIAEGAVNDTPAATRQSFDREHPPIYTRPPVITSLDFSPSAPLLAVAGFHEVLLVKADGAEVLDRLVGLSERIESVRFSPDGRFLAVTGGRPARMGELQVWNVKTRELVLSRPITYDSIYGGSWSPDGKQIAFGCADNTVRVVDASTGKQVLFQGAHTDWVRDTVFSVDGTHLVSVGRDRTAKLTEVATGRFVDNVTSITPGALKGGIQAVARHTTRDEIVIGGSDGSVTVYRMHRLTKRVIGDDANLIRQMPPMKGRIFSVVVSRDGKRIAAGSSLNGVGEIAVYSYEFETDLPAEIKKILEKRVSQQTAQEKATLAIYLSKDVKRIATTRVAHSGIYAVAFHPDGRVLAAAGADGQIRLVDARTGSIRSIFSPFPIHEREVAANERSETVFAAEPTEPLLTETLPKGVSVVALKAQPTAITLNRRFGYVQLVVHGTLPSGNVVDVTRMVKTRVREKIVDISPTGWVCPKSDGKTVLEVRLSGQAISIPVTVTGQNAGASADFIQDVNPVLSRVGCNKGTCHGAAKGKHGFKLSLRGYDAVLDLRALTDDLASRRVNVASPETSLMLLKPTAAVPHEGGQVLQTGTVYYEILHDWISHGARLDLSSPRVRRIEVFPKNAVILQVSGKQQFRVLATYTDGTTRDVTHEAYIESGDTEVAVASRSGLMTALRRGEAPVLARYDGTYAATTLTVMGNRSGFVWKPPPTWNRIDELVAQKWQRMKITPSKLCSDTEFIRRVYLDLTGMPPTVVRIASFLADSRETRTKRADLIDELIGSEDFVEHWTNKWADLLQVNRKYLGAEGAAAFRNWIREQVAKNVPYNQFVRSVLTASGSNHENPAASYFKILRTPGPTMENTTQVFLGVRFSCNKCHDHPFERWTQDQYYQTAAYFARVDLRRDPASGKQNLAGTAVEGAKPLYEIVADKNEGDVIHLRTGKVASATFPFPCQFQAPKNATRRQQLAAWLTSPGNPYFARSYVNRLWGYLFGIGLIEPIDDIRAGNPPTNPELLDELTRVFVANGFNVRHLMAIICKSRTYQLSIETNQWNADDARNYSHALARRLPAEVLYDTIYRVTGSVSTIPGVPAGTRAAALPDSGVKLPDGFLANLGRPPRESGCECERASGLQLGPVMALINGPTVAQAIDDPENAIARLIEREPDNPRLLNRLFLRVLNRPARDSEIAAVAELTRAVDEDHTSLVTKLKEREAYWKNAHPRLKKKRATDLAAATQELAEYEKQIAPRVKELEGQRTTRIHDQEKELQDYETQLPKKVAEWVKTHETTVEWFPLEPIALSATNGARLTRQSDRSIRAEGKATKGTYTVVARTNLRRITGIRLEALPDATTKGGGPGLAPNGNFVVTEFELKVSPAQNPKQVIATTLVNGHADFNQVGFNVNQAVDGVRGDQRGWAVSPAGGVVHWLTFETSKLVGYEGGTILRFTLYQNHNAKLHRLARFRISVTQAAKPVGISLPESLKAILDTGNKPQATEPVAELARYFRAVDPGLLKKKQDLAEARKPVPVDAGLTTRRDKVAFLKKPVPEDALLLRLRRDVKLSAAQLKQKRLTVAQDVTWALINSPEFLFNH